MNSYIFIAVDPEGKRRQWSLEINQIYAVGRDPGDGVENPIAVDGDRHLSRHHFSLNVKAEKILVERSPQGRNPLYFDGGERDVFSLRPGQVFYTGKTQFGVLLQQESTATTHYTLVHKAKEEARLRRLEDCFSAVLELLAELRRQNETPAWQVAFPVLRSILPEVEKTAFLQLHQGSEIYRVIDADPAQDEVKFDSDILLQASRSQETVTCVWDEIDMDQNSEQTLSPKYYWVIVSPIRGLESSQFLLCVSGSGTMDKGALEERATLVDLVGEMVGHHIVIRQGSEYSSLLGVFGHHVGTLFKTSGALQLWSNPDTDIQVKRVLNNLLPIWGISQAISLHKKQGEKAHQALLETWVAEGEVKQEDVKQSLLSLISHVFHSAEDQPFLPWTVDGREVPHLHALRSLPPLDDVPLLFDKTLAIAIGLIEILNNVRKYPTARGTGREDRLDLAKLSAEERVVNISCIINKDSATVEIDQPVVTAPDGTIPRSRSLERIRALEQTLLGALVGTEPERITGPSSSPHVVRVTHRWNYHYGQLLADWRTHCGS